MYNYRFHGVLLLALLAGCGGKNDSAEPAPVATTPSITNAPPAAGSYSVSLGDTNAPLTGQYYLAADGSRLLILNNASDMATTVYQAGTNGIWQATPATAASVSLLKAVPSVPRSVDPAALAGSYVVRLDGMLGRFTLAANGSVSPLADSSCKISGQLEAADWVSGVRRLRLAFSACGSMPASLAGHAIVDAAYAPVRLRIVLAEAGQLAELWAYAE